MRKLAIRTLAFVLLSLGLLPLSASLVHAQDAPATRVGVAVSAVINAKAHVGPRISAALGKALGETLNAEVLAGPDAQARLPEAARNEACLGDSTCLVSAGKALGVDQLLMLIIVGVGDELKIEATWVDVGSGETALRSGITTADTDDSMHAAFAARAQELLPGVPARTAETSTNSDTTTVVPVTTNTEDPVVSTQNSTTTTTKSNKGTAKLLMLGGGLTYAAWIGYGAYIKSSKCSDGESFGDCEDGYEDPIAADIIFGGLGTIALTAGLYLYLTDDAEAPKPSPVGVNVGSDSFALSYGGSF